MNDTRELALLVKIVFQSEKGKELLKILSAMYQDIKLKGNDPYETAYKVGQNDVIREIKSFLYMTEKEINDMNPTPDKFID
jgi:hypothetical protein